MPLCKQIVRSCIYMCVAHHQPATMHLHLVLTHYYCGVSPVQIVMLNTQGFDQSGTQYTTTTTRFIHSFSRSFLSLSLSLSLSLEYQSHGRISRLVHLCLLTTGQNTSYDFDNTAPLLPKCPRMAVFPLPSQCHFHTVYWFSYSHINSPVILISCLKI